jgi:glucosamine--fructose-6-phosphate aminotransferase (isomerizing)
MCGITGYVGDDALSVTVDALQRLEYRGYDSAGVALLQDGVDVYKTTGGIDDLDVPANSTARCAIGHTRWSTHGKPTVENAHPHTDCTNNIAVVHNGIIANYDELKAQLVATGHTFTSQTDTEVVAHLLEDELPDAESLRAAVTAVTAQIGGAYALAVVATGHDGIVCARQNSPLVVGHGDGATHVASDVTAFLHRTRRISYVDDGDVVVVTDAGPDTYAAGELVDRPVTTVDWEPEAAEKGGYDHFMLKEIHEQPNALRQTLAGRLSAESATVDIDLAIDDDVFRGVDEIQLLACGTSYHAALYAKHLFQELADIRTVVEVASEYEFEGGRDPARTLVIGVTQSGETADTLQGVRRARAAGARTFGVTNTLSSTITREVEASLFIRAGPEIGVAATKTFSSQVAALSMLALHVATVRDRLDVTAGRRFVESLQNLPAAVQQVLDNKPVVQELADTYSDHRAFFYIGRRVGTPVSLEGALKLKEISYMHAEGFPAGELKHGPLALVSSETPVFAMLTESTRPEETANNVREVQARDAPTVALTSDGDRSADFAATLPVPSIGPLEPLAANVYLQLFAYYLADRNGLPIDKPRNLAKSVTVE